MHCRSRAYIADLLFREEDSRQEAEEQKIPWAQGVRSPRSVVVEAHVARMDMEWVPDDVGPSRCVAAPARDAHIPAVVSTSIDFCRGRTSCYSLCTAVCGRGFS
jgi:hypothetical protein